VEKKKKRLIVSLVTGAIVLVLVLIFSRICGMGMTM